MLLAACGKNETKPITTQKLSNGITVTLMGEDGKAKNGENDFTLEFKDAAGQPVDVGKVLITINMPATSMMEAMNATAQVSTISTGKYKAKLDVEMKGDWTMTIAITGPAGDAKTSFAFNA